MPEILSINNATELLVSEAKTRGASFAESKAVLSETLSVTTRMQKTEKIERADSCGVDLRFIKDNRQVVLSSSDLSRESLLKMVDRAEEMVKYVPANPYIDISAFPALSSDTVKENASLEEELELFDQENLDVPAMEARTKEEESVALSYSGITNSEGADFSIAKTKSITATSFGSYIEQRRSDAGISISVIADSENGAKERDYAYDSKVFISDLKPSGAIGKEAAERTLKKLNAVKLASASLPLIFEPRTARSLLGIFASAINGESVSKKLSFLSDMLGKDVFGKGINIIDDPHIKRGARSRVYDAEGFVPQKSNIIKNGVLESFLLSLETAKRLGLRSTAHAVRGLGSIPYPSASNIYIENGSVSPEELIKSVKRGVFITEVFGQGVNMTTGDYSKAAAGLLIEEGEFSSPVHEITVAGNLSDMFKNMTPASDLVLETGKDSPTLLIEGMTISGC